ncbi:MAG: hypothetical protein ABSA46_14585 [Thermodesulfovibrionales bacterium]
MGHPAIAVMAMYGAMATAAAATAAAATAAVATAAVVTECPDG